MGDTSITPHRHTRLTLDTEDPFGVRPPWDFQRAARHMNKGRNRFANTQNVTLQPGEAWTLSPHRENLTQTIHGDVFGLGAVVSASDVNMAPGYKTINTWKAPTDITGASPDPNVLMSGSSAFTQDIAATDDTSTHQLAADAAAYPGPLLLSADFPMDRVISGRVTYPENAGFGLVFSTPDDFNGSDNLLSFYFGGPSGAADLNGSPALAGQFVLNIRGDGLALLSERTASGWAERMRFPWSQSGRSGNFRPNVITVFPYANDSLVIRTVTADGAAVSGGFTLAGLLATTAGASVGASGFKRGGYYYRNNPQVTGHYPGDYMTGMGTIRLDVRRTLRSIIQLVRLIPAPTGNLVDLPWWVPFPIPGFTPITVNLTSWVPKDAGFVASLFTNDGLACAAGPAPGSFYSFPGRQAYYLALRFNTDSAGVQTPVLYDYSLEVQGVVAGRAGATVTGGNLRQISITGPDLTPDHDSASLSIEDPADQLSLLGKRGRIHCKVVVNDDAGHLVTVLHEGETARADALEKGKKTAGGYVPSQIFPKSLYPYYELAMVGMWARISDQVNIDRKEFAVDPLAPLDPVLKVQPPWKVTDVIRFLLLKCGFTDETLDIPDIPIRLAAGQQRSVSDFMLLPQQNVAETILRLARGYLGMVLLWDANAGVRGMWRLIFNPQPPFPNVLADFVGSAPLGRLQTHPNSYPTVGGVVQTFMQRGTVRRHIRAPECNYVLGVALGTALPLESVPGQIAAAMFNPNSFQFPGYPAPDPTNVDFLGRFVPVLYVDTAGGTAATVGFAVRRIYDIAAHGQVWRKFRAPLVFVNDSLDPHQVRQRPLRIYDAVRVRGATCLIRSVNMDYRNDNVAMAHYEALQVN